MKREEKRREKRLAIPIKKSLYVFEQCNCSLLVSNRVITRTACLHVVLMHTYTYNSKID